MAKLFPNQIEQALGYGLGYVLAVEIEGIPTLFVESNLKTTTSTSTMALPARFDSISEALVFSSNATVSTEADQSGVARGDALSFTLAWENLEADNLLSRYFSRATKRSRLSADLAIADTSATVESTDTWYYDEIGYLGRDTFKVQPTSGTTFDLVGSRNYEAYRGSPSSFSWITNVPEVWRGRFVTLYLHVLSPDQRVIGSTWTEGLCTVKFRGFIEAQPAPTALGFEFRALPLERLLATDLGHEITLGIVQPGEDPNLIGNLPVLVGPESYVRIEGAYTGGGGGTFQYTLAPFAVETVTTVVGFAYSIGAALDTALTAQPWYTPGASEVGVSGLNVTSTRVLGTAEPIGTLAVKIPYLSGSYDVTTMTLTVPDSCYFLQPGSVDGTKGLANAPIWHWTRDFPAITSGYPIGSWLPVVQTSGNHYLDIGIPTEGVGLIEVDETKELVAWDRVLFAQAPRDDIALLHICERGVSGTPLASVGKATEIKFVSGTSATPGEIALRLIESSGSATRGTYDVLPIGQGYGISSEYVDEASFLAPFEINEVAIAAYSDGRTSCADLIGGWLALHGLCIVARALPPSVDEPSALTAHKITVVRTDPGLPASYTDLATTITPSDIELGGMGMPTLVDPPTEVRIDRSGIARDVPSIVAQDLPLIQASGHNSITYSAPGLSESAARDAAESRIARGFGRQAVTLAVVPALGLSVGDAVKVNLAHPSFYDWESGTRAPASIYARVVGTRWYVDTGRTEVTLLCAGVAPEGLYLSRCAAVTATWGTGFSIDEASGGFLGVEKLTLYNPGFEGTERATYEVYVDGSVELGLTTGSLDGWVDVGTIVTYPERGAGNADSEAITLFYNADKKWSA